MTPPFSEMPLGTDAGHYLTMSKFAEPKPEVLRQFTRALRRVVEWYTANRKTKEAQ